IWDNEERATTIEVRTFSGEMLATTRLRGRFECRLAASGSALLATRGDEAVVLAFPSPQARARLSLQARGAAVPGAVSPDGARLAIARGAHLETVDLATFEVRDVGTAAAGVELLTFSPDARTIAAGLEDATIELLPLR